MSFTPSFPEPGVYVRYWDQTAKEFKFIRLMERSGPLKYPRRLPQLTAGSKGDTTTFDELNPSETKKHRYMAYVGVRPGFQYYLWHPYDVKLLKWDEDITDITEDDTANLTYEESPYEAPTKFIWIQRDRYPALQARNVSGKTGTPEVIFIAMLYIVLEDKDLDADTKAKLRAGQIPSIPISFGGEM